MDQRNYDHFHLRNYVDFSLKRVAKSIIWTSGFEDMNLQFTREVGLLRVKCLACEQCDNIIYIYMCVCVSIEHAACVSFPFLKTEVGMPSVDLCSAVPWRSG